MSRPAAPPDAVEAPAAIRGGAALAVWHAGWAAAVGLTALGGAWFGQEAEALDTPAALAMATPGLLGLVLLGRDGLMVRAALLAAWSLAAIAAAGLSGGLTGPLGAFVFMPVAAAIALGTAQASGLFDSAEPKGHGRRAGGQQGGDSGHAGRGLRRAVDGGGDQARQRRQRRSQGAEGGQSH